MSKMGHTRGNTAFPGETECFRSGPLRNNRAAGVAMRVAGKIAEPARKIGPKATRRRRISPAPSYLSEDWTPPRKAGRLSGDRGRDRGGLRLARAHQVLPIAQMHIAPIELRRRDGTGAILSFRALKQCLELQSRAGHAALHRADGAMRHLRSLLVGESAGAHQHQSLALNGGKRVEGAFKIAHAQMPFLLAMHRRRFDVDLGAELSEPPLAAFFREIGVAENGGEPSLEVSAGLKLVGVAYGPEHGFLDQVVGQRAVLSEHAREGTQMWQILDDIGGNLGGHAFPPFSSTRSGVRSTAGSLPPNPKRRDTGD